MQKGMTLGAVLGKENYRRKHRTLLDFIRQEEPNCWVYENLIDRHKNRKGSRSFNDRLRPKRGLDGDVWAAGVPVPASDVAFHRGMVSSSNAMGAGTDGDRKPVLGQLLRARSVRGVEQVKEDDEFGEVTMAERGLVQSLNRNRSFRFVERMLEDDDSGEVPWVQEVQLLNQTLSRVGSSRENDMDHEDSLHIEHVPVTDVPNLNSSSSMLTGNPSQIQSPGQSDEPVRSLRLYDALAAEREHLHMVVSSTETDRSAPDEEVTETSNHNEEQNEIGVEVANEQHQVRMSLMDFLDEADSRQIDMSSYSGFVDVSCENTDEFEKEEGSNFVEQNCCVCMVRHKGSAFIPCGHTFCRLCSRKLLVNRGNCPICNGFILEVLDIF